MHDWYLIELRREAEVNRKYFERGKGSAIVNVDEFTEKHGALSDRGSGADRVRNFEDYSAAAVSAAEAAAERDASAAQRTWNERKDAALRRLEASAPELVDVFLLICEFRSDRQSSIGALCGGNGRRRTTYHAAEMRYFRHRKRLLEIFV